MNVSELLRWQWQGYSRYHQSRFNLLLHIVMVPLFLFGNILLLKGILRGSIMLVIAGIVITAFAIAMQGRGHHQEPVAPEPFTSPANAVVRIFLEQWITFPRFVLSGGWLRVLRQSPH